MPGIRSKTRWSRWLLGTVAVIGIVLGCGGWRVLHVAWELRKSRALLHMGSAHEAQVALRRLESVEKDNPQNPELLFLLGRATRRSDNVERCLKYLQQAADAGWDPAQIQQQQQLAMFQRGHIDDSSALDRMLSQNSEDELAYEVYESLAKGYLSTYRLADAVHCLDFWSDWCTQATDPRMWRASIWEQTERWEKAVAEYREILKIDPKHQEARLSLARILLLELNKADEAYQEFQRCLQQVPEDFNAQVGLATCERRMADSEKAESRMQQLLKRELSPSQLANVRMELGQILLERRALPEAVAMLKTVVETDPLNSSAHYVLGSAYAASGDPENAKKCFETSRLRGEQFARLTEITTELVNHPDAPDLRWEAGKIMMDQGMYTEGAAWMATALIYDPEHRPTHESLARYYEQIKPDERLAKQHREKAGPEK